MWGEQAARSSRYFGGAVEYQRTLACRERLLWNIEMLRACSHTGVTSVTDVQHLGVVAFP